MLKKDSIDTGKIRIEMLFARLKSGLTKGRRESILKLKEMLEKGEMVPEILKAFSIQVEMERYRDIENLLMLEWLIEEYATEELLLAA